MTETSYAVYRQTEEEKILGEMLPGAMIGREVGDHSNIVCRVELVFNIVDQEFSMIGNRQFDLYRFVYGKLLESLADQLSRTNHSAVNEWVVREQPSQSILHPQGSYR